jgi:hypothetical protein
LYYLQAHRHGVTIVNYEAQANPKDHKTSLFDNVGHEIQWIDWLQFTIICNEYFCYKKWRQTKP